MLEVTTRNWTEPRIATLKKLWRDGYSASQIAAELGGVSRSGILGKVHRLGLSGRRVEMARPRAPKPPRPRSAASRQDIPAVDAIAAPPAPTIDDLAIPVEQRKTFLELTFDTCRWPVGDPGTPEFFFCGATVAFDGAPYCRGHQARAGLGRPMQRISLPRATRM